MSRDEECTCGRCEELEEQIEFLKQTVFDLEDLILGEYDSATALAEVDKRGGILDRLDTLERDDMTVGELLEASDNATLPIQQLTAARKAGHMTDEQDKNRYRATFVWSEFYDRATKEPGRLKLPSQQVQNILADENLPTNRNTVRRVMEFAAKFSNPDPAVDDPEDESNLLTFRKRNGTNVLVADRDEYESLAKRQDEQASDEADAALDRLSEAKVATDGGGAADE